MWPLGIALLVISLIIIFTITFLILNLARRIKRDREIEATILVEKLSEKYIWLSIILPLFMPISLFLGIEIFSDKNLESTTNYFALDIYYKVYFIYYFSFIILWFLFATYLNGKFRKISIYWLIIIEIVFILLYLVLPILE